MIRFWTAGKGTRREPDERRAGTGADSGLPDDRQPGPPDGGVSRRLVARMMVPMIVAGAMLLSAGLYGAWRVHALQQRGEDILSENVASIRAAEELETLVREFHYRLKRYLSSGNGRHLDEIARLLSGGDRWLAEADRLATTRREQQLVGRIRSGYQRFREDFAQLRELPPGVDSRWAVLNLADEIVPHKILVHTSRYIRLNEEQLTRSSQRNQASANRLMLGLLLLGTFGGVAGLLAGYGIARRVSRTIVQLSLPIRDAAGKLNEVVGPVVITTEPGFKDLETILQTMSRRVATIVERLQESERDMLRAEQLAAVGQLAAGLAHELRNPLTAIKTIVQLAEAPHDLTARDLDVLEEEVRRLEQSVQAFLDFARPPDPQRRDTPLAPLLEHTVDLVARRARQQGVRLHHEPFDEDVRLFADAAQIRQVVLNLLLNAFDAVPPGGSVRLRAGVQEREAASGAQPPPAPPRPAGSEPQDRCVVIEVRDDGAGLPAELGDRIFEPFVSTKPTGTGLGLSICRRIVEAHGGAIAASSPRSGGAVFTIRLPLPAVREPVAAVRLAASALSG